MRQQLELNENEKTVRKMRKMKSNSTQIGLLMDAINGFSLLPLSSGVYVCARAFEAFM